LKYEYHFIEHEYEKSQKLILLATIIPEEPVFEPLMDANIR